MSEARAPLGLLDTSVIIAAEGGRPLREEGLPKRGVASVVTLAELRAGVLKAEDIETRDRRLVTLERLANVRILPVDDLVARMWAGMWVYLGAAERRVAANDLWIAATAAAHRIPVVTQDADFDALSGVNGLTVIPV